MTTNLHDGSVSEDSELAKLLLSILRWKEQILKLTLLGCVLGAALGYFLEKKYRASASFISQQHSGSDSLALSGSAANLMNLSMAMGIGGGGSTTLLYLFLLKSNEVQNYVVQKADLIKHYELKDLASARAVLGKATFSKVEDGDAIRVTVEDNDPVIASTIANEYVHALNSVLNHMTLGEAERHASFLEARTKIAFEELREAEKALTAFQVAKGVFFRKSEIESSGRIKQKLEDSLIDEQLRLTQLMRSETQASPRVSEVQSNIEDLRRQIKNLSSIAPKSRSSRAPGISSSPEVVAQLRELERNAEIKESIYELLIKELELAKASAAKERLNVVFIDTSEVPQSPFFPNKKLFIAIGTAIGFLIGILAAMLGSGIQNFFRYYGRHESVQDLKTEIKQIRWNLRRRGK